jgi:hypothetical protein
LKYWWRGLFTNLAESSKEGYGTKGAVLPVMMMMMMMIGGGE